MLTPEEWRQLLDKVEVFTNQFSYWRRGQKWFNALYEIKPELADEIRSTDADPFYKDDNLNEFFKHLAGAR